MSERRIVIGLSGEPGAGKDTVKDYLGKQYGADRLGFSLILKGILERLHLPLSRESYALLAEALRESFGEGILSEVLVHEASNMQSPLIVIDGIRKQGELDVLKRLPGFRSFFVDADIQIRFERIRNRGSKSDDTTKTFEEFVRDHERAADRDVQNLREKADIVIENNGTREELATRIDDVMRDISHT